MNIRRSLAAAFFVAAVAAPTAFGAAPALAEELPTGQSQPDTAPATGQADDEAAKKDAENRAKIEQIKADPKSGPIVREAAEQALAGTPADRRQFLDAGRASAQLVDDRLRVVQIMSLGGKAVRAAANAALSDSSPAAITKFLEVDQFRARAEDNRAAVAAAMAGPYASDYLREAAGKALDGGDAAVEHFLTVELPKIQLDDLRVWVARAAGDPKNSPRVREAAEKALKAGDAAIRHFLDVELPAVQASDRRVRVVQIYSDPASSPAVREAAQQALNGSDADVLAFLEHRLASIQEHDKRVELMRLIASKDHGRILEDAAQKAMGGTAADVDRFFADLPSIRRSDDQLRISQLAESGGPAVRKAALAALGTGDAATYRAFLTSGLAAARARDNAATTGNQQTGTTVTPASDTTAGTARGTGSSGTTTADRLASTGTETPFGALTAAGGAAVLLGAGALVATRRRIRA
ncbi:ALF repeat-containing protein [Kitasatospora terrestris]|uniref:Gram-positive cocci surface proteins LPxTG domain-containing protein n=1 Tax=Kitasatospora terrestris TaxID=258051 RepID=A0ABP9DXD5_9ACTN